MERNKGKLIPVDVDTEHFTEDDYETYIEAQFEALSFCNGIPKIEDLYGDKANQRLLTYVPKYNIPLKTHKVEEDVWNKFKQ